MSDSDIDGVITQHQVKQLVAENDELKNRLTKSGEVVASYQGKMIQLREKISDLEASHADPTEFLMLECALIGAGVDVDSILRLAR